MGKAKRVTLSRQDKNFPMPPKHNILAGLVAQSVMSATDMLGYWDVCGLSAIDPRPRQWISICTMPKDVGMP